MTDIETLNVKQKILEQIRNKTPNQKKTKRINLWVTEEFYNDIKTVTPLYPGYSLSEVVVELASVNLETIKQHDVWNMLIELKTTLNKMLEPRSKDEEV